MTGLRTASHAGSVSSDTTDTSALDIGVAALRRESHSMSVGAMSKRVWRMGCWRACTAYDLLRACVVVCTCSRACMREPTYICETCTWVTT